MKDKQRIYSGDWIKFHPYQGSASTDLYYIQLANRVWDIIRSIENHLDEEDYLKITDSEQKELACILTAYFEDIISQTGIFQAFTRVYQRRYGNPLPFFTLGEEYAPGEINTEEVQFLVWHYFMQLCNLDVPFSPVSPIFQAIAEAVMEIFEEEYETAPENEKFRQSITLDEKEMKNLYSISHKLLWFSTQSYLFSNNSYLLEEDAELLVKEAKEANLEEQAADMVSMLCDDFAFNHVTELMRLTPPQWYAELLGEASPLYASFMSFGRKYTGYFRYMESEGGITRFRHIASERVLEVCNRSLAGMPQEMKDPALILHTGFIEWNGEWWQSGPAGAYDETEDLMGSITGDDDEYNLFEAEEELPDEEQQIVLNDMLAETTDEDGNPLEPNMKTWQIMLNDELSKEFFKSQVQAGKIEDLQFLDEPSGKLLLDNLDFVVEYIKR